MRIYKAMIIGFMMISWISCSDDVSSTEVENEVYNLKGIAATGYALVNKEVDVYNQDGQHLINSSTDEHGKFSTDLQGEGVEKGDFLIFEVQTSDSSFLSVSYLQDSLFVLINPLTDYVARKKFFLETGILISEVPTEIEWREVGDVFIQILFGDDAQFEDYGENENFIAGLEIGEFENISVEDVFIHTLGILAEQKEQSVEALIESIENSGITLFEDGEFSIALSQTLQELELEEAEVEEVFVDYLEEDFYKEMDLYYDQFEELLKTPLWQNSKWVNNDAAEDLLTYSMTEAMIKLEESDEMTAPYLIYLFPPFGNHLIELMNKVVTIPDTDETMDLFEKYLSLYSNNLLSVSKSISYENWESSPSLLKIKY